MHYEDIKLKQSTYAIISFNDRDGPAQRRAGSLVPKGPSTGLVGERAAAAAAGGPQPLWIYIHLPLSLPLQCPDVPHSLFIKGINFSNVHNCEP